MKRERWSSSYIYHDVGGAVVHTQIEYVGYGFTHYHIVGSRAEIDSAIEAIKLRFPTMPYGTGFNWPPGRVYTNTGEPILFHAPEEISADLWWLTGLHSNSSD